MVYGLVFIAMTNNFLSVSLLDLLPGVSIIGVEVQ